MVSERTVREFTVEANPNTLDADKVDALVSAGVNRVSLGAQSFHPHLLERLERDHAPASVGRAVSLLRDAGVQNISVDLIFGVPGQTLAEWQADLDRALELATTHLSAYGLQYEKGTRLYQQRKLGIISPVADTDELAMYGWTMDRLAAAGWHRYEISNYARRPGLECQHNLTYWRNQPYFGLGTGAAAYVGGCRANAANSYIDCCCRGESPIVRRDLEPSTAPADRHVAFAFAQRHRPLLFATPPIHFRRPAGRCCRDSFLKVCSTTAAHSVTRATAVADPSRSGFQHRWRVSNRQLLAETAAQFVGYLLDRTICLESRRLLKGR